MPRFSAAEVAARRAQVVELRRRNVPFDEIGRLLDVSPQRAHQLFQAAIAALPARAVAEFRQEALDELDEIQAHLRAIATAPRTSDRSRIEAWRSVLAVTERRAKLLGLDQPVRREISLISEDATAAAIRQLEQEIAEADAVERALALLGDSDDMEDDR